MSEQQDRNFFADGVTFMMKRALVLVSVVALLIAIVAVQMSPRNASADEVQASDRTEAVTVDVESGHQTRASEGNDVSDVPQADDGEVGTETGDLPDNEPSVIDTATELNAPELQTPKPAERLPQEYEDALANWPADEASEFREYYLAHPDELELIDVKRLIREDQPVVQRFDVRAAGNAALHDPSKECGLKIAIITDVSSSVNENDPNGISQIKRAHNEVIDQLTGTNTTLGLYNFSTHAGTIPDAQFGPKELTAENAKLAKRSVNNLSASARDNGNTNWEEGLSQVEGKSYDVIIFITDGLPNDPGAGTDVHADTYSLLKAQQVADKLVKAGSNIIPIFVGKNDDNLLVYPACSGKISRGDCTSVGWPGYTGVNDSGISEQSAFLDPTNRPAGVVYKEFVRQSEEEVSISSVRCNSGWAGNSDFGKVYKSNACYRGSSNNYVVTTARSTPEKMTASLSPKNEATLLGGFGELTAALKKRIQGCDSPKIAFEKYVKTTDPDARPMEADTKGDAVDLGNDNDNGRFSQDFVVTNKGASPIGYFELTDKQLEVPSSGNDSLSLDGLTCSGAEVNLSSDKKTARITPNNPVSENQSVRCTQTLDIDSVTFRNVDDPMAANKFFGNEATVTAKTSAQSTQATTVKDTAWAKAQPDLQIFKSYNPGTPRTITGEVGQQFTADYNIILTNNAYVEGSYPAIIDTPKPAPGLKIVSMKAFDREIDQNSTGNLSAQQKILRDGSADLTHESGNSWKLASGDLLPFNPRSKGQVRLRVTYEVARVLQGEEAEKYLCKNVRGEANNGTGLNNTLDVETGRGLTPVGGSTRDVCYSVLRADTTVIKKINGAGDPVNPAYGVTEQKAGKTVDNPENKDSFSVSYVIRNDSRSGRKYSAARPNADLPPSDIVSVNLADYALDDAGNRTDDKVQVNGLSCAGDGSTQARGTYDAESDTVTFDPALPAGESVTCTGTVHLQDLGSHVYGGVHGDEVAVTPTYRLNVGQTPGEIPSNDDSDEMTVTGPEESDKAWVKFPTSFNIKKYGVSDSVVIKGQTGETFEATYRVTVDNRSAAPGTPKSIIESPSPMEGVRVTSIHARNTDGSNNKLLKDTGSVEFDELNNGTYKLDSSNFNSVPGSAGGNTDTGATIDVIVAYEVAADNGIVATSDYLECSTDNQGSHGLANSVQLEGDQTTGSACIDLLIPRIELEKLINDEDADSQDTAAAIIPGAPTVKISYRVTNGGKGTLVKFSINDRYGEEAGSGRSMNMRETLECDKNADVRVSGSSGVTVLPTAALGEGESITCWWNAANPSAMQYRTDGYHVDTATVTATFQKSNQQGAIDDIQASDSAWAIQLKSLDGKLPKSGGLGIAPFGLGALILFAGALFISRRQRKA
ncbi:vWA domain-containing protein [Corynebacterium meridianum]|uniref:VWA domain-containing protein n=1 Tax=Corynebacterium meridianum TaxID=2765363 RepID=A0A934I7H7_9CORY|nr:vWA domain-containing protein [Corynebacterium meridianum]MBI8989880.1 VWA domain-containing protein [Corynebacterium meridianum]